MIVLDGLYQVNIQLINLSYCSCLSREQQAVINKTRNVGKSERLPTFICMTPPVASSRLYDLWKRANSDEHTQLRISDKMSNHVGLAIFGSFLEVDTTGVAKAAGVLSIKK